MASKIYKKVLKALPSQQQKHLKKLAARLKKINSSNLPIDKSLIEEVVLLYRGKAHSWLHEPNLETTFILIRVKGLKDEGLSMHLTETAKVFQWILWQPLLGEDSQTNPERCWREDKFSNPADFLASYVTEKKQKKLREVCKGRWDTNMMLGGAAKVEEYITAHIKKKNKALVSGIKSWLKGYKWHKEWDWETIANHEFLNKGFDIFWESDTYEIPKRFKAITLWTPFKSDVQMNILETLRENDMEPLPGMDEEAFYTLIADPDADPFGTMDSPVAPSTVAVTPVRKKQKSCSNKKIQESYLSGLKKRSQSKTAGASEEMESPLSDCPPLKKLKLSSTKKGTLLSMGITQTFGTPPKKNSSSKSSSSKPGNPKKPSSSKSSLSKPGNSKPRIISRRRRMTFASTTPLGVGPKAKSRLGVAEIVKDISQPGSAVKKDKPFVGILPRGSGRRVLGKRNGNKRILTSSGRISRQNSRDRLVFKSSNAKSDSKVKKNCGSMTSLMRLLNHNSSIK